MIFKIHRSYFRQGFWFKIKAAVQFPTLRDFPLVKSSNVGRNPEEYYSISRIWSVRPTPRLGQKACLK